MFFLGNIAAGLLQQAHVNGFKTEFSIGFVLLATLSFHGVVIALGTAFLISRKAGWSEVMGTTGWLRSLGLVCAVLVAAAPLILGLEWLSVAAMQQMHLPVENQAAVKMILSAPPGNRASTSRCAQSGFCECTRDLRIENIESGRSSSFGAGMSPRMSKTICSVRSTAKPRPRPRISLFHV